VATAAVGLVGAGVMAFAFEEPLRQARGASA
jgi:hypothetical protein